MKHENEILLLLHPFASDCKKKRKIKKKQRRNENEAHIFKNEDACFQE